MSAWPIVGAVPNLLNYNKLKPAMAAHGKNKYYRLRDIQPRHFLSTAQRCGAGSQMQYIIDDLIAQIPQVIETVDD